MVDSPAPTNASATGSAPRCRRCSVCGWVARVIGVVVLLVVLAPVGWLSYGLGQETIPEGITPLPTWVLSATGALIVMLLVVMLLMWVFLPLFVFRYLRQMSRRLEAIEEQTRSGR